MVGLLVCLFCTFGAHSSRKFLIFVSSWRIKERKICPWKFSFRLGMGTYGGGILEEKEVVYWKVGKDKTTLKTFHDQYLAVKLETFHNIYHCSTFKIVC